MVLVDGFFVFFLFLFFVILKWCWYVVAAEPAGRGSWRPLGVDNGTVALVQVIYLQCRKAVYYDESVSFFWVTNRNT